MNRPFICRMVLATAMCLLAWDTPASHGQIINDPPPTPGPVDLTVSGYPSGSEAMLQFSQKCTDGTNEPIYVYESTGNGVWNYLGQASIEESGGQFYWWATTPGEYYFYGVETVKSYNPSCAGGTYYSNTTSVTLSW